MEKKNDFSDFFVIFPLLEINGKKKDLIIMEKRKNKILCRKFEVGYYSFVLQEKKFVLQLSEKCIVRLFCKEGKARGQFVLQYNILYCDLGARQGWTVLQYSGQPSHDTATVATTRRWGAQQGRRRLGGALAGGAGSRRALGARRRAREAQACWASACGASGGARHEAATRPLGPATRQPEATIRPGSPATIRRWAGHDTDARARLGAPGALAGPVGGSCS